MDMRLRKSRMLKRVLEHQLMGREIKTTKERGFLAFKYKFSATIVKVELFRLDKIWITASLNMEIYGLLSERYESAKALAAISHQRKLNYGTGTTSGAISNYFFYDRIEKHVRALQLESDKFIQNYVRDFLKKYFGKQFNKTPLYISTYYE
jgi:hypothetical protein